MNTFVNAIKEQEAYTTNGMKARKTSSSALVDLFYNIGASRGKNIISEFSAAFAENNDIALRIALWARDVRNGAGERQIFRDILNYLERVNPGAAVRLLQKIPELGRYDDLFVLETKQLQDVADAIWHDAIFVKQNALAAKWTPRKGSVASRLQKKYYLSPKQFRKIIVTLTKVVETQMCANDWDNINFNHVPSQAARIYKKAFNRHTTNFANYIAKLSDGDKSVKVNANAIYPHEILKTIIDGGIQDFDNNELTHIIAQWDSLPNYVGNANIMPLVDVSGSMNCRSGKNTNVNCMDIAVSLGLYLADKNKGAFNGTFLTFSDYPELVTLQGNIVEKVTQIMRSEWGMSTDLSNAFDKILNVAVSNNVSQNDMPTMLLILSDMQFNECVTTNDSAMEMIEHKYEVAGYKMPKIVFWNLKSYDNIPVKSDKSGAALISGFSPSIMTSLLSETEEFTPLSVMLKTVMNERYNH